jgi:hypothetical protein
MAWIKSDKSFLMTNLLIENFNQSICLQINLKDYNLEAYGDSRFLRPGLVSSNLESLNKWYHVAFSLVQNNVSLFINGNKTDEWSKVSKETCRNRKSNAEKSNNLLFFYGNNRNHKFISSIFDEIKIFRGFLTSLQILNEYNQQEFFSITPTTSTQSIEISSKKIIF